MMFDHAQQNLAKAGRRLIDDRLSLFRAKDQMQVALKGLLRNEGIKPIGAAMEKRIASYARERFGHVCYAPWLVFYATCRGAFLEGWVPDNFFQQVAVRKINGAYHMADNARTLQVRLLGPGSMPDIAHFVSGEWRDPDGALWPPDGIEARIFGNHAEVCVKTEQSSKGRGVHILDRKGFDRRTVESLGNLVVQRVLTQSDHFAEIFPGAVTTVRVTTGKLPGQRPFMLFANLRMGRGEARTVTLGSIKAPIIDDDGAIGSFAYDSDWTRHATHPDTGFRFGGAHIPDFARLRDHCLSLHDRLPQFGLIGWDVTTERNGAIQLMEINTGFPGIKFAEAMVGPCLRVLNVEQYARRPARAVA
ncbi:sugar-transfer associated ATP-grasp domain-containing protein [Amaricoccus sp.]|uniref:sugar-transfer associated ATP-grasp domain-containing protein n=1 Tax=Amaricoccus sp. TaxID=1872485 RepID=UPI0025C0ED0B|nr:sugar-transfer associated ATP-grasp domain-containing protein [Amaricoccus sp.]